MSDEPLHLTEYEVQVLIGTSIHGCRMQPDRVFSLPMAWSRLFALGLIDRTDGLAIITDKGRKIVSAMLRVPAPAVPDDVAMPALLASHVEWLRGDHEACNPWLADMIEAQAAELARLSDALREISETRWDAGAAEACLTLIRQMARAALAQPTGD